MLTPDLIPNKDFFDNYNEAVLVASHKHGIIYINPAFAQLTGYSQQSGDESYLVDFLRNLTAQTTANRQNYNGLLFRTTSGAAINLKASVSPITISDLSQAQFYTLREQEVNNGEEKFYQLADASPAMILMEDKNGGAFYFNKAWLEFTGRKLTEQKGAQWKNSIHPDDLAIVENHKAETDERRSYSHEYRLQKYDGTYRDIFAVHTPVFETDGGFAGYMTSCLDITEIEEAQNKINALGHELKHLNEELEQFTYVTSHDLQEPLRMITGYIQLIQKNIERGNLTAVPEFMEFVLNGASRMQALIADLVKLSRVNRKGAPFTAVEMKEVVSVALTHLAKKIKATNASVEIDALPAVTGDTFQLVNLFENLLDNALKFTSLTDPPHIVISSAESEGKYIFQVKDNGIGIDNKFHKRIFAIFQRLHTRGEFEGTGIGLAVSKKIVERHGGEIWVESEPGKGSKFYFSIKK